MSWHGIHEPHSSRIVCLAYKHAVLSHTTLSGAANTVASVQTEFAVRPLLCLMQGWQSAPASFDQAPSDLHKTPQVLCLLAAYQTTLCHILYFALITEPFDM